MKLSRRATPAAVLLLVAMSGCVRPIFPGSEKYFPPSDVLPRQPAEREEAPSTQDAAKLGPTQKLVSAKEAPSTLVAQDGSRCSVAAKRFEEVREGEKAWCVWTGGRETCGRETSGR